MRRAKKKFRISMKARADAGSCAAQGEKKIQSLERQFVARSDSAFATAWRQAQASGQVVVISEQGAIYEIHPDGQRKLMKLIAPPTPVKPGLKVTIR